MERGRRDIREDVSKIVSTGLGAEAAGHLFAGPCALPFFGRPRFTDVAFRGGLACSPHCTIASYRRLNPCSSSAEKAVSPLPSADSSDGKAFAAAPGGLRLTSGRRSRRHRPVPAPVGLRTSHALHCHISDTRPGNRGLQSHLLKAVYPLRPFLTLAFRASVCAVTLPTVQPCIRFLFAGSSSLLHRFLHPGPLSPRLAVRCAWR